MAFSFYTTFVHKVNLMPKIRYNNINFRGATLDRINDANSIIAEYEAQGFDLTLRQLYYQFVARGLIPNNDREYKKLGDIIANGRLAGLIDWNAITDRTRNIRKNTHWSSPHEIVAACASQFKIDKWGRQDNYVEVWVEKDALIGVLEAVCPGLDVPYYACRGYNSISEIWNAGRNRLRSRLRNGKLCTIFYLGDHDPSGIDMTRDVLERLNLFSDARGSDLEVVRLALNMDQVDRYNPPENPTKLTDSRATDYISNYGESCWELDALDPTVITGLITEAVVALRDEHRWTEALEEEEAHKANLKSVAENWLSVAEYANGL
jgi:hypothetical protein